MPLSPADILPIDRDALLLGRVWRPDLNGPSPVRVHGDRLIDISATFPTARDVCEAEDPAAALRDVQGEAIGTLAARRSASGGNCVSRSM